MKKNLTTSSEIQNQTKAFDGSGVDFSVFIAVNL